MLPDSTASRVSGCLKAGCRDGAQAEDAQRHAKGRLSRLLRKRAALSVTLRGPVQDLRWRRRFAKDRNSSRITCRGRAQGGSRGWPAGGWGSARERCLGQSTVGQGDDRGSAAVVGEPGKAWPLSPWERLGTPCAAVARIGEGLAGAAGGVHRIVGGVGTACPIAAEAYSKAEAVRSAAAQVILRNAATRSSGPRVTSRSSPRTTFPATAEALRPSVLQARMTARS